MNLIRVSVTRGVTAKLGSSWAIVPTGVFSQELHEPSISKFLAKATKAAKSSQETLPPKESITESPEVMKATQTGALCS
jgi:hypothetical protein